MIQTEAFEGPFMQGGSSPAPLEPAPKTGFLHGRVRFASVSKDGQGLLSVVSFSVSHICVIKTSAMKTTFGTNFTYLRGTDADKQGTTGCSGEACSAGSA